MWNLDLQGVTSGLTDNDIVPLEFDNANLPSVVANTLSKYVVEGVCDSSLTGQNIRVSVTSVATLIAGPFSVAKFIAGPFMGAQSGVHCRTQSGVHGGAAGSS